MKTLILTLAILATANAHASANRTLNCRSIGEPSNVELTFTQKSSNSQLSIARDYLLLQGGSYKQLIDLTDRPEDRRIYINKLEAIFLGCDLSNENELDCGQESVPLVISAKGSFMHSPSGSGVIHESVDKTVSIYSTVTQIQMKTVKTSKGYEGIFKADFVVGPNLIQIPLTLSLICK